MPPPIVAVMASGSNQVHAENEGELEGFSEARWMDDRVSDRTTIRAKSSKSERDTTVYRKSEWMHAMNGKAFNSSPSSSKRSDKRKSYMPRINFGRSQKQRAVDERRVGDVRAPTSGAGAGGGEPDAEQDGAGGAAPKEKVTMWARLKNQDGTLRGGIADKIKQQKNHWNHMLEERDSFVDEEHVDSAISPNWKTVTNHSKPAPPKGWLVLRVLWAIANFKLLKCITYCLRVFRCVPVIMPTNPFVERWDIWLVVLLAYVSTVSPYEISFLQPKYFDWSWVCNRFLDVCFLFDMVLQFNLSVPGNLGELIVEREAIQAKYLSGWFLIDFMSIVPFDMIPMPASGNDGGFQLRHVRAIRMLRLMKMLRLLRANRMLARVEARSCVNYSHLQLHSFMLTLFLLCHWLACGWHMVTTVELNKECVIPIYPDGLGDECCFNWIDCYKFQHFDTGPTAARKYFLSLHWATGEVLTVGSDVLPVTDAEKAYQLVARVLSGILYAYLIGAVCSVFNSIFREQSQFYEDMDRLNRYLTEKAVQTKNPELCAQLRMFYRYANTIHMTNRGIGDILATISPNLRGALAAQVHSKWLKNLVMFRGVKLSPAFYVALAQRLETSLFAPLECIIEPHHKSRNLFVVDRGIIMCKGRVFICGDVFGADSLSTWRVDTVRNYKAVAFTYGKVNIVRAADLQEILNRPQFAHETLPVRGRIKRTQVRQIAVFFLQMLQRAIKEHTFHAGCRLIRTEIPWVSEKSLDVIFQIFLRRYKFERPRCTSVQLPPEELISQVFTSTPMATGSSKKKDQPDITKLSRKLDKLVELQTRQSAIFTSGLGFGSSRSSGLLPPTIEEDELDPVVANEVDTVCILLLAVGYDAPELAHRIVTQEQMSVNDVLDATEAQLHLMGIPMKVVTRLVRERSALDGEFRTESCSATRLSSQGTSIRERSFDLQRLLSPTNKHPKPWYEGTSDSPPRNDAFGHTPARNVDQMSKLVRPSMDSTWAAEMMDPESIRAAREAKRTLRASQIRMRNAQEAHESENLESAPAVAAKSDRVTSPVSSVWVSGDEGDDDERSGSVIMPSEWSSGRLEHADSRVDADQPTDT
eukprot:CAMPEP_0114235452 /NCGR_PEP_ID=MMETSP0058-20121206/6259_1 /TAXON_ID=36894 /ORGANISM="Pyramimonas parkeae, CCMP726" /LENGTH=1092 /DNA_ID=CAMNT_0001347217 /DNA_START=143 /DNA_END=3421 /DNA_ORIENTATION=+